MTEEFNFFITSMPSSRQADYYIGCLDGSVFIDFNRCPNGQVCLKRISFDKYGCYQLNEKVNPLNKEDSQAFRQMMDTQQINQLSLLSIVKKTIQANKTEISQEALDEYNLI